MATPKKKVLRFDSKAMVQWLQPLSSDLPHYSLVHRLNAMSVAMLKMRRTLTPDQDKAFMNKFVDNLSTVTNALTANVHQKDLVEDRKKKGLLAQDKTSFQVLAEPYFDMFIHYAMILKNFAIIDGPYLTKDILTEFQLIYPITQAIDEARILVFSQSLHLTITALLSLHKQDSKLLIKAAAEVFGGRYLKQDQTDPVDGATYLTEKGLKQGMLLDMVLIKLESSQNAKPLSPINVDLTESHEYIDNYVEDAIARLEKSD